MPSPSRILLALGPPTITHPGGDPHRAMVRLLALALALAVVLLVARPRWLAGLAVAAVVAVAAAAVLDPILATLRASTALIGGIP